MNLKEVKTEIDETVHRLIAEKLSDAVKQEKDYHILKKYVPELYEIKMMTSWSGFNDGDPEYAICVPLFRSYCGSLEESFKAEYGGDGYDVNWADNTDHDDMICKIVEGLNVEEFKEFTLAYENLCESIFDIVGHHYEIDELILIEV